MSFVLSCLRGIGVFIAATASFCIAMTIAISGPPTASEMTLVQNALTGAMGDIGRRAREAGAEACADMPADAATLLCAREQAPPSTKPPVVEEAPPPPRRVEVAETPPVSEPSPAPQPRDLLGGPGRAERVAAERPARADRVRPARRAQARPARERRAQPVQARAAPRRPVEAIRSNAAPIERRSSQAQLDDIPDVALSDLREPEPVEEVSAYEQDWPDTEDQRRDYYEDGYEDEPPYEDEGYYPDPYEVWDN